LLLEGGQPLDGIILIVRLLLAVVLVVAGTAKAFDLEGSRKSLRDFGVPDGLTGLFSYFLPFLEIGLALALIPVASAWYGAAGALALLVVFTGAIVAKLARGEAASCHCFGKLETGPIGWETIVRNVVLMGMAGSVVLAGKSGVRLGISDFHAQISVGETVNLVFSLLLSALVVAAIIYVRRVLGQLNAITQTLASMKSAIDEDYAEPPPAEHAAAVAPAEGLPVGVTAPRFTLPSVEGENVALSDVLARGKSVLLLFVSPHCPSCKIVLNKARDWRRDLADSVSIVVVSKGSPSEIQKHIGKLGLPQILIEGESNISGQYRAKWTPAAVVVGSNGRIVTPISYGEEGISKLITETFSIDLDLESQPYGRDITLGFSSLKVGEVAPRFALEDLRGNVYESEQFLGRETLLLFWNPTCPFCEKMSDELKRWEAGRPDGAPELVVIASFNNQEGRMTGGEFQSLILVDPEFNVAPLFGSASTPSAVLIDEDGRIASAVAIGQMNVMALTGSDGSASLEEGLQASIAVQ
jgi:peroxiredoxin/uncharacterized membrane protein YphA (DoxX/SURF4 family)